MRSTANAGMSTEPPRSIVVVTTSASRSAAPASSWRRFPYVDSTRSVSTDGGGSGATSNGCVGRPRSPLNPTAGPSSPSCIRTVAEPRMWPALDRRTETPSAIDPLLVERDRAEQLDGAPRVVLGVQGKGRVVTAESLPVGVLGLLLVEVAAVRQHDAGQAPTWSRSRRRVRGNPRRPGVVGSRSGRRGRG